VPSNIHQVPFGPYVLEDLSSVTVNAVAGAVSVAGWNAAQVAMLRRCRWLLIRAHSIGTIAIAVRCQGAGNPVQPFVGVPGDLLLMPHESALVRCDRIDADANAPLILGCAGAGSCPVTLTIVSFPGPRNVQYRVGG